MDVIVTTVDGHKLCNLQVKTRWQKGSDGGWHMGKKHETISSEQVFYCFVDLGKNPDAHAVVFVVPSEIVAKVVKDSHSAWLQRPGRNNKVHNDSDLRRFLPNYEKDLGPATEFGPNWLDQYREDWGRLPLIVVDPPA
jgi:hypothetical protein